ncbi:hypothetical protein V8G54_032975 [Vigna mungo]|uniref:Retrovirus-related Pol polyprotein from transposon TNT 1-94-like beta-barrel domain-containing protein n=1 Tax=Vigna mungo TaxID=3915 RepID=A0AAQ3MMI0_VIGMU
MNFSHVCSQIMLMEPMPTLPKTFSLVLQQEREFHNSSSQVPQDSMASFNFQDPQNKTSHISRGAFYGRGRGRIPKFSGRAKYCEHCKRTNHTSDNCWIKYGLPQGYKPTIKPNSSISNPSAHLTDGVSHTSSDSPADKTQVQCSFSQEQYDAILGLLKQSQPSTPKVTIVNQGTPQSSGSFSKPNFSSWIIDSGATDHICSSRFLFNSLQPITPISIRLPNHSFVTAKFFETVVLGRVVKMGHNPWANPARHGFGPGWVGKIQPTYMRVRFQPGSFRPGSCGLNPW